MVDKVIVHNEKAPLLDNGNLAPVVETSHPYFFQQVPLRIFIPFQIIVGIPPMIHYAMANLANTRVDWPARIVFASISALVNGEQYPQYNHKTLTGLAERAMEFYEKKQKLWTDYLFGILKAVCIPVLSLAASITYYDSLYEALGILGLSYNAGWATINVLMLIYNAFLYVGEVYDFVDKDLPVIARYVYEVCRYMAGKRDGFPIPELDARAAVRCAILVSAPLAVVWSVADWYATGYLIQQAAIRPELDWLGPVRGALQQWWVALLFCNAMNGIFCVKKAYQGLMVLGKAMVKLVEAYQSGEPARHELLRNQTVLWTLAVGSMFTAFFMAIVSTENGADNVPGNNSTINGTVYQTPAQRLYHLNLTDTAEALPSDPYRDTLKNVNFVLTLGIMAAFTAFAVNAKSINGSFLHFVVDKSVQSLALGLEAVVLRPVMAGARAVGCGTRTAQISGSAYEALPDNNLNIPTV